MKVLFAPLNYIFSYKKGVPSEVGWSDNVFSRLHNDKIEARGIVSSSDRPMKRKNITSLNKESPYSYMSIFKFIWRYYNTAKKEIAHKKYDIVHHFLPFRFEMTFNPLFIFKEKETKYVIGPLQNELEYESNQTRITLFLRRIIKIFTSPLSSLTLKNADAIICLNDDIKKKILKKYPNKIVEVIPPGVDSKEFYRKRFSPNRTFRFVLISALVKRKRVGVLLKALRKIDKKYRIEVRIIGAGSDKKKLEEYIMNNDLGNRISFLGRLEKSDVSKELRSSDVLIHTSDTESFGQVYLEAMSSGLPVITTVNDGSRFIVKNKETGLFYDGSSKDLASSMIFFLKNPEKIKEYGMASRERIERNYDWEKVIIPRYIKIYNRILSD